MDEGGEYVSGVDLATEFAQAGEGLEKSLSSKLNLEVARLPQTQAEACTVCNT